MSGFRLDSRQGQFIPITALVVFTSITFLVGAVNVYRVARAKLQAQNIADAAALAIAAMEAKEINVVIDRNEWMNHMYPDADRNKNNPNQLPNISDASKWGGGSGDNEQQQYAQLVATINQAQQMFQAAYNRFLGDNSSAAGNGGAGGIVDILSEISGLKDRNVQLIIFNTDEGQSRAVDFEKTIMQNSSSIDANTNAGAHVITAGRMAGVQFKTVDVKLGNGQSLSKILKSKDPIGWMRPDWEVKNNTGLTMNTTPGQSQSVIGAGAIVIKNVELMLPFIPRKAVIARASAYVVKSSGLSSDSPSNLDKAPVQFRPTYYVKLAYPK
jgi:hypothetical protein